MRIEFWKRFEDGWNQLAQNDDERREGTEKFQPLCTSLTSHCDESRHKDQFYSVDDQGPSSGSFLSATSNNVQYEMHFRTYEIHTGVGTL